MGKENLTALLLKASPSLVEEMTGAFRTIAGNIVPLDGNIASLLRSGTKDVMERTGLLDLAKRALSPFDIEGDALDRIEELSENAYGSLKDGFAYLKKGDADRFDQAAKDYAALTSYLSEALPIASFMMLPRDREGALGSEGHRKVEKYLVLYALGVDAAYAMGSGTLARDDTTKGSLDQDLIRTVDEKSYAEIMSMARELVLNRELGTVMALLDYARGKYG